MKKALLGICCFWLILGGCREKDLPISFGAPVVAGNDSAYVGPVPATQPHNVLVEEFTGQNCDNCPAAHALLDNIAAQPGNVGRINIVSMYFFGGGNQTFPPKGAKYDFRDSFATNISNNIYGGLSAIPTAGIDRTLYQNSLALQGSSLWPDAITNQESIIDSVNLSVSSNYNNTSGLATIKVTVTYTQPVATSQNISVYIVEDSIIDFQTIPGLMVPVTDSSYLFLDIFRAMVSTPLTGDPILENMAVKPAGQVYWRKYTFNPATTLSGATKIINPAHCQVIAFVNNTGTGGDYRVLQSVQCPLVP